MRANTYKPNCSNNSSIVNSSMKNGLQMNLKDALEDVGVHVSDDKCLWEYPDIIRKNLVSKTVSSINIKGKDIINISEVESDGTISYEISTSIDSSKLPRPNYSEDNANWNSEINAEELIVDLFNNILPSVRGVYYGDSTVSGPDGNDESDWSNELFNKSGNKSGLVPNSKYLRLYLTCQAEPLYINMGNAIKDITKGYDFANSDTVEFTLNEKDMTITSHINIIPTEHIEKLK